MKKKYKDKLRTNIVDSPFGVSRNTFVLKSDSITYPIDFDGGKNIFFLLRQ